MSQASGREETSYQGPIRDQNLSLWNSWIKRGWPSIEWFSTETFRIALQYWSELKLNGSPHELAQQNNASPVKQTDRSHAQSSNNWSHQIWRRQRPNDSAKQLQRQRLWCFKTYKDQKLLSSFRSQRKPSPKATRPAARRKLRGAAAERVISARSFVIIRRIQCRRRAEWLLLTSFQNWKDR